MIVEFHTSDKNFADITINFQFTLLKRYEKAIFILKKLSFVIMPDSKNKNNIEV